MTALHNTDVTDIILVVMYLQTVIEAIYCIWSSLKSATNCCQTEQQTQDAYVSLNNDSMRTV